MRYFEGIKTIEDLKQKYKKFVKELHPDLNKGKDTTKEFVEMKKQYEEKIIAYTKKAMEQRK